MRTRTPIAVPDAQESSSQEARPLYLRGWRYCDGVAMLDAARVTPINILEADCPPDVRCLGFFHVFQGETPCAIFALDRKLFLQIAVDRWEFKSDRVRIKHRRGLLDASKNYVAVHAQRKLRFRASYTAERPLFDPTWDGIDEETSDWWLWLTRVVTRRMDTFIELWEAGI